MITLTEDEFIVRFQPETHPDGSLYVQREWSTHAELRFLEQMHYERRLWTVVIGDCGNFGILQGYCYVNRDYYIVCAVPYASDDVFDVQCEQVFCSGCGARYSDGGDQGDTVPQSTTNPYRCTVCEETEECPTD